jgi:hypothetical protein
MRARTDLVDILGCAASKAYVTLCLSLSRTEAMQATSIVGLVFAVASPIYLGLRDFGCRSPDRV